VSSIHRTAKTRNPAQRSGLFPAPRGGIELAQKFDRQYTDRIFGTRRSNVPPRARRYMLQLRRRVSGKRIDLRPHVSLRCERWLRKSLDQGRCRRPLEVQSFAENSNTDSVSRITLSGGSRYLCHSCAGNIHILPPSGELMLLCLSAMWVESLLGKVLCSVYLITLRRHV
jgi:hypothetical protein